MGNPPFHGFTFMTAFQKEDMQKLFPDVKNLDFVCAWYKKASDYIRDMMVQILLSKVETSHFVMSRK